MVASHRTDLLPTWDGPEQCPFCGAPLADGGPAFMAHVALRPECHDGFDTWRQRVVEDISGEWPG